MGILTINKQILHIENKPLRIPTGGTLTTWLFAQRDGGVELRTFENKSSGARGKGEEFEPGSSRFQIQRPKPLDHAPSV